MKKFTPEQLRKIHNCLKPHLAEAPPVNAEDYPMLTLKTLLAPTALSTRDGILALSDALYRLCGLTINRVVV